MPLRRCVIPLWEIASKALQTRFCNHLMYMSRGPIIVRPKLWRNPDSDAASLNYNTAHKDAASEHEARNLNGSCKHH